MNVKHIHAGGVVGGFSVCGAQGGTVHNDADESNCIDCITKVRDWIKPQEGHKYTAEVKRACANVGIEF